MKTFTKQITLTVVFALLTLYGTQVAAQCQAGFTWSQSAANVIDFTNTTTNCSFSDYSWDFGDNQSSFLQNPQHTYNVPGTYYVCLTVNDSNIILSTFCDTVTVTGSLICNLAINNFYTTAASCQTCADGSAYPNVSGGTSPFTYQWSNGGTDSYITGVLPGAYAVCITDINGCSVCDSVLVPLTSCSAAFTWTQASPNVINFTDASLGTGPNTEYTWDFGDNSYGYGSSPVHTYSAPGTYTVCLTISDTANSNNCNSTFCDTITVTSSIICNISLYAYSSVSASCWNCADGEAVVNASGGSAPYTYSWSTGATTNTISNVLPGTYSVCASDANGCTSCTAVTVDSTTICNAYFYLYPDTNNLHTYYAVNASSASSSATYLWSWGDGNYDTTPYPTHTYASAGFYQICLTVTDSVLNCTSTYCDSQFVSRPAYTERYYVGNELNSIVTVNVIPPTPTAITSFSVNGLASMYPNPVKTILTISVPGNSETSITYKIFSLLGSEVLKGAFAGQNFTVNVEALTPGIYLVELKGNGGILAHSKFVKE